MSFDFTKHLIINRYKVQIQFNEAKTFHYFHGAALNGFFCKVLQTHPLGKNIVLLPIETGHVNFESGDKYNFIVTTIGEWDNFTQKLTNGLKKAGSLTNSAHTFSDFNLIEITQIPIPQYRDTFTDDAISLHFNTPLRMAREKPPKGKSFFDPQFFDASRFVYLLYKRVYELAELYGDYNTGSKEQPFLKTEIVKKTLLWVDAPYHAHKKTFGGIIGDITFKAELNEDQKHLLWLGQLLQIGRNTALGFGNYSLNGDDIFSDNKPVKTLIDRIISPKNLLNAFAHIKKNSSLSDTTDSNPQSSRYEDEDKESYSNTHKRSFIKEFEFDLYEKIKELSLDVTNNSYTPSTLKGLLLKKPLGSIRALTIPSVRDRVLQRAMCQIIAPDLDKLFEDGSFAYRKGYSRTNAAKAVSDAYQAGYHYVLESDINSFFDNVDWYILMDKIKALYSDKQVIELIDKWVKQDVSFRGQIIKREKGLPQGSSISPVLANLYLDEFDEAISDDFKIIRYADDFLVLCKSKERAMDALKKVKESLKQLELEIKPAKTKIVSFDHGFQYIGYIFCRSVVMETEKKKKTVLYSDNTIPTADMIPDGSWLTHVDFKKIRNIETKFDIHKSETKKLEQYKNKTDTYPVYLLDPNYFVRISKNYLIIEKRGDESFKDIKIPIEEISAVIDYGKPSMTVYALTALAKKNISTFFCNYSGKCSCIMPGGNLNYALWLKQEKISENKDIILDFVKEIIETKIHNYRTLMKRHDMDNFAIEQLGNFGKIINGHNSIESIRGYEGKAAAIWFSALSEKIDIEWGFTKRTKNPPTDPVNSMLSFGYTILYHHISTAIQIEGLNPSIGIYHKTRGNFHPLASDIQEEFRYLIDSLVLYLLNRNMVTSNDFYHNSESKYPYSMTKEFRKLFIGKIEERFLTEFKPSKEDLPINYLTCFQNQARMIKSMCLNNPIKYKAIKIY